MIKRPLKTMRAYSEELGASHCQGQGTKHTHTHPISHSGPFSFEMGLLELG